MDDVKQQTNIMQMIDKGKMKVIQQAFTEEGLDIYQFIKVMHQHLNFKKQDPQQLVKTTVSLIDLFRQIDVNGDATMEWDQFNNYVIQLGMLRNDRSFKNVIKSYYPSQHIRDRQKHQNGIDHVYYFQKLKYLLTLQKDSARFKVYNASNCSFVNQIIAHKTSVLCAQYIPCQDLIATSSDDLTINFWQSTNFAIKQIVSVPQIQLCMKYADWKTGSNPLIYTGGTDAIIHIYDAMTLKQKDTMSGWNPFFKRDQKQYGHSGPIGDILPIQSQQALVTASYDTKICLWDSVTHSPKKTLCGHNKGVYSLDWSDYSPMNQCLVSAGLDHDAYIWNTYVSTNIFLLRGHNHPLVGVKCLPSSPQIITADISGMIKVWDVRNFLCMQTFNQKDQINSFCLTYSYDQADKLKKRFVCAGRKLKFFQYDQPKDQFLTDEKMCIKVIFNQTLLVFITLHPQRIKVWDAITGKLQSVYRQLSINQLTTAVLDSRQRKLFIGTMNGEIFTVNIRNGAKMRQFISHSGMISGLCHWTGAEVPGLDQRSKDQRRLISISKSKGINGKSQYNDRVFIHDEDSPQGAPNSLRYKMNKHQKGCNSVVVMQGTQLLASCADDGTIVITNLLTFRQFVLSRKQSAAMTKLIFLDPHDCLVATDQDGMVHFFGVNQNRFKNQLILQAEYTMISYTQKQQRFPITAICFEKQSKTLIIGDPFGNIDFWDVSQLCQKIDQYRVDQFKKRTKIHQDESFMTSPSVQIDKCKNIFYQSDIKRINTIRKAHNDGITHLEIVKSKYSPIYVASSSFDCCVYIWSFEGKKQGSLILGQDRNWKLSFDIQLRQKQAYQQAKNLLQELSSKNHQQKRFNEDDQFEYEKVYRIKTIEKAKQLINMSKTDKRIFDQQSQRPKTQNILDQLKKQDQYSILKGVYQHRTQKQMSKKVDRIKKR